MLFRFVYKVDNMNGTIQDGLPQPRRNWAMAVIALGMTMAVLDGAIADVALPTIAEIYM